MMPKRKSAFNAALQEAQQQAPTVTPSHSETVQEKRSEEVSPSHVTVVSQDSLTVQESHSDTVEPFSSATALQEESETVPTLNSTTVKLEERTTASPPHSETVKPSQGKDLYDRKVSFYLTTEQENKLDDLAYAFKKQHGRRINRNDIVRYLIDTCTLETLNALKE